MFTLLPQRAEIRKLFGVILVTVNFLAVLGFAKNANAFFLKYTSAEILSILAFTLSYTLLETFFVTGLFLLISMLLPKSWLRDNFSTHGMLAYLLGTAFLYPWFGYTSGQGFNNLYIYFNTISQKWLVGFLWCTIFIILTWLVIRMFKYPSTYKKINQVIDRISILGIIYLVFDCIAVVFVIIRLYL